MSEHNQRVILNQGLSPLQHTLHQFGVRTVAIFAGTSYHKHLSQYIEPWLQDFDINWISVKAHLPLMEEITEHTNALKKERPQAILAIGGGRVIDVAKASAIFLEQKNSCYEKFLTDMGSLKPRAIPFIIIPSTAGSGSESTHFAVVYAMENKYSLAHASMLADVTIADQSLVDITYMPDASSSAIDALCQAIESWWSKSATAQSRMYSEQAIECIVPNIEKFLQSRVHVEARSAMVTGANLAGKAINLTKTTAAHALSYYLTQKHGVPHGHAVSVLLGGIAQVTYEIASPAEQISLKNIFAYFEADSVVDFFSQWQRLLDRCAIPARLSTYNIDAHELENIITSVNVERLGNHPVKLSQQQLHRALSLCL